MKQTYKRETSIIGPIIVTIISIIWLCILISFTINHYLELIKLDPDIIFGFVIFFLTGLFIKILITNVIYSGEYVKTDGFIIYEYKCWDTDKQEYINKYIVDVIRIKCDFFYNKLLKTYKTSGLVDHTAISNTSLTSESIILNKEQIKGYILNEYNGSYSSKYPGYNKKEDAMKYIYDYVKDFISEIKGNEDLNIKNIIVSEYYSVEDIQSRLKE